jgi:hypothetical protein
MCTPLSSLSFSGLLNINGIKRQYNNQPIIQPSGFSSCIIRDGTNMTIKTTTPSGSYTNIIQNNNGNISGKLNFPGATIHINGKGLVNS